MFFDYNVFFSFFINALNSKENADGVLLRNIFYKNKLFLETDVQHDTNIAQVYACAAQQIGIDEAALEASIKQNFLTVSRRQ